MIKTINNNLNVIESMLYFWQATKEKEKVGENYLVTLSEYDEMKLLYSDDFDAESVRKSLSAISNREMLNGGTQKERQFWNNNMWMLEDMDYMRMMVDPLKKLSLDTLVDSINSKKDIAQEEIEVVFIPANKEEYIIKGNKLVINFFKVTPDLMDEEKTTIEGKNLIEYIEEKILENF